jgi:hypothetical protein
VEILIAPSLLASDHAGLGERANFKFRDERRRPIHRKSDGVFSMSREPFNKCAALAAGGAAIDKSPASKIAPNH